MSYENVPKNKTEQGVLVRGAHPDYFKLLADAFPVPTADESGAVLVVTDTGDRYSWTSTQWVQTHYFGLPVLVEQSTRGGLSHPVILQDQTTDMLDLLFLEEKVAGLTLSVATVVDAYALTLTAGHGLTTANSAGHIIELAKVGSNIFMQATIMAITGDVVALDSPICCVFAVDAATVVQTGNPNMAEDAATGVAIDGSVTPVVFAVIPLPGQSGDITRTMMASKSANEGDTDDFCGAAALIRGLTLRKRRQDGTFKNLYNYKTNFDFDMHGHDVKHHALKGGGVVRGVSARVTYASQGKHGVAERLDGALGEQLQIVVGELMDITASGNTDVRFIAEGSELQGD